MRDKAAEIFVERYRAFSSQQHPRIPRNAEKNLLVLGTPKTRAGGKISFFTGALYNFYVHSTILKISTPAAGRHLGFFLASLEKTELGVRFFLSLAPAEVKIPSAPIIPITWTPTAS